MFSSANKTTKTSPAVQQQTAGTFFRKAEEPFFGTKQNAAFFKAPVQAKLTVSTPDDPQEKEADAVAEKVMRMPEPIAAAPLPEKKEEPKLQTKRQTPVANSIQCKAEPAEKLQAKPASPVNISLYHSDVLRQSGRGPPTGSMPFEQVLASSKGGGSVLPGDTQQFMESRFSADFSGVRIHTDSTAENLSRSVNAQAFAHGNDIYFNSGKFSPHSTDGRTLLAHELTHTIQQGASKSITPAIQTDARVAKQDSEGYIAPVNKDISKKEETEQKPETPQEQTVAQPKAELSNWSVNTKGTLEAAPPILPPLPEKLQAKEEKKEEEDKTGSLSPPEVQKKHEQNIHRKDDLYVEAAPVAQASPHGQLQASVTAPSINRQKDIGTEAAINGQDRGPPAVVARTAISVQRSVVDDALGYAGSVTDCISIDLDEAIHCAKDKARQVAMHIPGYKALRVVLGEDPITGEGVARNGHNFIEAAFDIMPGGSLLHKKLDEIHKLDAAAQWIDERISEIADLVSGLSARITSFWNSLGVTDLSSPMDVLRQGANIVFGFIDSVIEFAKKAALDLLKMVKDFLLDKLVEFVKKETTAYPLLTVILGQDPITEQKVERNGTNILNGVLELGGEEGRQQKKKMDETGTFAKAAGYIDEAISVFGGAYEELLAAFHGIWNEATIENLMDPVGTFQRIYNNFAAPILKVWDFIKKVGAEILKYVKEVMMKALAAWAKTVKGYKLVTVIIGEDPFTQEAVPPTVENMIHGFMSLMDGGEEQFRQMKESGAVAKAEQKIKAAVKKLNMTPQVIIQLFIDLWNAFSIADLMDAVGAFKRILATFGEPIARLIAFVVEIVKIVVEVILIIMQFPFDLISNIMAKAMQAFQQIKKDPVGFLKNLLRAIKEGFVQFFGNILKHLLAGLTGWLMSELKDSGVKAPKDFSLGSIIGWVLELLGISMEKIWEKLAKHPRIGPERVAKIRGMISKLEGIWTFIKDVQERGMAAIWDKIVEKLTNLWDTVLDAIKNWIMQQIVEKMVVKLLSMLDPTGIMAVVNSAIALYKAIQSFKKYLMQMLQIVNSFVEGVAEIASGNTKKAADFLESTLARGVPVVIGFLANQVGLSGVGKKVGEMIEKVREMVDKALTWLVNKAVDTGLKLLDKVMALGASAVAGIKSGFASLFGTRKEFKSGEATHHAYFEGNDTRAELMIESEKKPFLKAVSDREAEITEDQKNDIITGPAAAGKRTKLNNARNFYTKDLVVAKEAMKNEPVEAERARLQREIFRITDKIIALLADVGVTNHDLKRELMAAPVVVGDNIKRFLQPKTNKRIGDYWKVMSLDAANGKFIARRVNPKNNAFMDVPPGPFRFDQFNILYTRIEADIMALEDPDLIEQNAKNAWSNYEIARRVLNYRVHEVQTINPSNKQWEHIVEKSAWQTLGLFSSEQVNCVTNLLLADAGINYRLGQIFTSFIEARPYLNKAEGTTYLDTLIQAGAANADPLSPRAYLSSVGNIETHRKWKGFFYRQLGVSPGGIKNIDNRGDYRTLD